MLPKSFIKLIILILLITMVSCVDMRDPETLNIELNPGVDTVEINTEFNDAGAKASLEGKSHPVQVIENNVDTSQIGTYEITYQTTFGDVTLEITRYVDVVDETPPSVTLNPGIDTVIKDTEWIDAGVDISDNSGLDVNLEKRGQVSISQIGEYQITYTATDSSGNQTTIIRFVHVIEE
ncbi:MAG: immunoglobulin-like domain-containing protein [Candidatus Izemoplasmatales bacterium]